MPSSFSMADQMPNVTLLPAAADAAGRTSAKAVSCKHLHKVFVEFHINQGNAATVLLTVQQAQAVAKTGAKAIPVVAIWANLDETSTSVMVRQTDAVNFTTDAGVASKTIIFEIDPSKLDVAGGFDCLLAITGASNVANITSCRVYGYPSRHGAGPNLLVD